jgi:hypothetical protein
MTTAPCRRLAWAGFILGGLLQGAGGALAADVADGPAVVVVVGAAGEEDYGRQFADWAGVWRQTCARGGVTHLEIGRGETNDVPDRARLEQALGGLARDSAHDLWLVLLGHGTFDGQASRFNLRGPDVSADELAAWLAAFRRRLVVVNCASGSAGFIPALTGTNRVVVTATQSGYEQNFARFGEHFARAVADPAADLDKDGQTSLLEAFLAGARRVAEFYETDGRLATEHALLDDNGDGKGTPADWFQGVRASRAPADGLPDGLRAHQVHLLRSLTEEAMPAAARLRRDELELAVERLRGQKAGLPAEDYYRQLEVLLLDLARVYQDHGQLPPAAAPAP